MVNYAAFKLNIVNLTAMDKKPVAVPDKVEILTADGEFLELLYPEEFIKFMKAQKEKKLILFTDKLSRDYQLIKSALNEISPPQSVGGYDKHSLFYIKQCGVEFRDVTAIACMKLRDIKKEYKLSSDDLSAILEYAKILVDKCKDKIPFTQTSAARNDIRSYIRGRNKKGEILYIKNNFLYLNGEKEARLIENALTGGHAHGSINYIGQKVENCICGDMTSAYIYSMFTSDIFPMSRGVYTENPATLGKCFIARIQLQDIYLKASAPDPIISATHGIEFNNQDFSIFDNKVMYASDIIICVDSITLKWILKFYDIGSKKLLYAYKYKPGKLPDKFRKYLTIAYKEKLKLKPIKKDHPAKYQAAKGKINCFFGIAAENPLKNHPTLKNGEIVESASADNLIDRYNKNPNRFTFYPWGVFVAALCRDRLLTAVSAAKSGYVYSDTDSYKGIDNGDFRAFTERENGIVKQTLIKECEILGIDPADVGADLTPADMLGAWDIESDNTILKIHSPRSYMSQTPGSDPEITQAGLDKIIAAAWIKEQPDPWQAIDHIIIPPEFAQQKGLAPMQAPTYIDRPQEYILKGKKYKTNATCLVCDIGFSHKKTQEAIFDGKKIKIHLEISKNNSAGGF